MPNLFLRFVSITAVAGVALAGVGLALVPAVQVLGDAGHSDEARIDLGPLDQRSYVYAADGSLLTTLQAEIDRQPVALSEIPQHTVDAVLAVEDADFFAHDGVNLRATVRALIRNVDEGETVQGGSTITQQVVKEELVGNAQTVDRKAREAVLARRLEDEMTKPEILERYLNTVYLGNGAYGVQAGAETYFGVGVSQLNVGQSAFLAGLIANPSRFDPIRAPEASLARRDLALRRMAAEGHLTEEEAGYIAASAIPAAINQVNPETLDYFAEQVKQVLFDDPRLGSTREERQNRVFRGGLRIHTTLDPKAQAMATSARNDVLAEIAPDGTPTGLVPLAPDTTTGEPRNATGAVVSVEPGTGAVRAMVGGAGFESEKFNVTTQGTGRSGGSTFKVFVLMALLENGYLPTDSVSGSGACTFEDIPGMFPNPYRVENFGGSGGGGGTILSQTLRSSNCAFVRLGQIVGIENVVEQAHKMGITTPLEAVVSMPLGTKEVLPIDMAGALASIAADGMYHRPYFVDRVEDPDGQVLIEHEPDPRRASSVQSARLACDVLEKNVQSGTGTRARIPGQHAAGKTGTAQNASDGWFVGFTPYLATATWIGSPTDNEAVEISGTGITGGSYPAEVWGRYMRAWHEGLEERECGDYERANRSSRYLSMDRDNDSGGGSSRSSTSAAPPAPPPPPPCPDDVDAPPPRSPTPPSRAEPTTAGGDGGARARRGGRHRLIRVSAVSAEARGCRAMTRWDDLLAVQEHDTTIDQLVHRRAHLPSRAELDGVMAELARLEAGVAEVEEARHGLGRDQQRLEDEISGLNDRANHHDKTLYSGTIGNPRELQSLQDEIASLKRRISQLEDQELEVMEQIEPLDAQLATFAASRATLDERGTALRAQIAEEEVAIDGGARAGARRAGRAGRHRSTPTLRAEYDELRKRSGGIAIARMVGGSCGGCHLALSAVDVDRIKKLAPEAPAYCEECGRLLAR